MSVIKNLEVRVRGTVQGVGFRPMVWRLAQDNELVGEVHNDTEGVLIRICGPKSKLSDFLTKLPLEAPPLSKIDAIEVQSLTQSQNFTSFQISHSDHISGHTEVSADAASCQQCLEEMRDAGERRYMYPFTNCTHCGPRLSIIEGIPYDRVKTTMVDFPMCSQCQAEYKNPADRRFHAQPIACHSCGPRIYLETCDQVHDNDEIAFENNQAHTNSQENSLESYQKSYLENGQLKEVSQSIDKLAQVHQYLSQGKIVAVRGIGGFHLCCDASNNSAVARLRQRKHRYAKPFALMSHKLSTIENYCRVSQVEREQLQSAQAPIVLLARKKHPAAKPLSRQIAPGTNLLGFMLPYTPLHWLICEQFNSPLVMTSGNLSQQPQITDNSEAFDKLNDIADLILYHDREIANRMDDSVVRCIGGKPRLLRRARGFAPRSIHLPKGFEQCPDLLAYGAELKSTFCLVKNGKAVVSQHQGDLEDLSTFDDYEKNLALYTELFQHQPNVLVADKHPEYLSTKMATKALSRLGDQGKLLRVQHHHAHIASCLAENNIPLDHPAVLGIALDGLGFGEDGTIWGGEFLLADYYSCHRLGRFKPVAMIGGTRAIAEPWRNTYAHILAAMPWADYCRLYADTELGTFLNKQPLETMGQMLNKGVNVPPASSCGRLFDAVSAALGICRERARFEGQGAIELETLVNTELLLSGQADNIYVFDIEQEGSGLITLNAAPMWHSLLRDQSQNVPLDVIATRFHGGLITAITQMLQLLLTKHGITTVALSGGCMQNRFLLEGLTARLQGLGITCLSHSRVPSNDGGISLGQAAIAAAQTIKQQQLMQKTEQKLTQNSIKSSMQHQQ